jgi:Lrp/AsnC family transcriptional regulator, leucine-responsive regulatory protein
MDATDLRILTILAENGRAPFSEIAEQIGFSGPATADRVRRLEERGAIRGYAAEIDPAAIGLGLTAFVAVTLGGPGDRAPFLAGIARMTEVVECHHVAGDDDYLLKVHVDGTLGLEQFVSEGLKSLTGVVRTRTTVVLSTQIDRALAPAPSTE